MTRQNFPLQIEIKIKWNCTSCRATMQKVVANKKCEKFRVAELTEVCCGSIVGKVDGLPCNNKFNDFHVWNFENYQILKLSTCHPLKSPKPQPSHTISWNTETRSLGNSSIFLHFPTCQLRHDRKMLPGKRSRKNRCLLFATHADADTNCEVRWKCLLFSLPRMLDCAISSVSGRRAFLFYWAHDNLNSEHEKVSNIL